MKSEASENEIDRRYHAAAQYYVTTPQTASILKELDRRRRHRIPGEPAELTFMIGRSRAGKSSLLKRFCESHPTDASGPVIRRPILAFVMPADPAIKAVGKRILKALGDPLANNLRSDKEDIEGRIIEQINLQQVELIICDETHRLLQSRHTTVRQSSTWLQQLLDASGRPVVCAGLPSMTDIVVDTQLQGRSFASIQVRPFSWDTEEDVMDFLSYLVAVEEALALPDPSNLHERPLAAALWIASAGLPGVIKTLLKSATAIAGDRTRGKDNLCADDLREAWDRLIHPPRMKAVPNPFSPTRLRQIEEARDEELRSWASDVGNYPDHDAADPDEESRFGA